VLLVPNLNCFSKMMAPYKRRVLYILESMCKGSFVACADWYLDRESHDSCRRMVCWQEI